MTRRSDEIAEFLGLSHNGRVVELEGVAALDAPAPGSMVFAKIFNAAAAARLNATPDVFAIVCEEYLGKLTAAHVVSSAPRLDYARAAQRFFDVPRVHGIAGTAVIAPDARIGARVSIGEYCVVGRGAEIGEGTVLEHHVVLGAGCVAGKDCHLKSHSVIGEKGFGFERDETGVPVALPHFGRVRIGDRVEIGALNTIARGTIGETAIGDDVKTDDHVHIAHNCRIGAATIITACAELSGSVRVGERVWIGPGARILNGMSIGDGAFIGLGAVVTKPVEPGRSVAGNPARVLPPKTGDAK